MNNTTTKNTQSAQLNAASSELKFVSSFMALHMSALSFLQERSINLFNNTNPGENQTTRKPLLTLINMKNQTKKQILTSCLIALSSLFLANGAFAAAISSSQNGPWTSTTTWNGGVVPTSLDDVTINHTVTTTSGNVITVTSITISSSRSLTNNGQITISGNLTGSGTLTQGATGILILGGTNTVNTFSVSTAGNIVKYNSASAQDIRTASYKNLVITGVGVKTTLADLTVAYLTVDANSTMRIGTGFKLDVSGNFLNNGTFNGSTDDVTFQGNFENNGTFNGSTGDVTFQGNFENNGTYASGSGKINLYGDFTNDGTFTAGTSTVYFKTNGKSFNGSSVTTFYKLTLSRNNSYTNNTDIIVSYALGNSSSSSDASTLILGANAKLTIGGTISNYVLLDVTSNTPNTIAYASTNQAIRTTQNSSTLTYNNLEISGTSQAKPTTSNLPSMLTGDFILSNGATFTTNANLTLPKGLIIGSGSTFTMGAYTLTIAGDLTNSGTFTGSANNVSVGGNITNNNTFTATNASPTYTLTGASKSINGSFTIANLTVSGSYTNNSTLSTTNLAITGSLINNGSITVSNLLSGAGSLTQNADKTLTLSGITPTITTLTATASGNTVTYSGASQAILNTPYAKLVVSGTGKTYPAGLSTIPGNVELTNSANFTTTNNLTIEKDLIIGAGSTFTMGGSYTLTVKGNYTNNGTFTGNTANITFNGTAAQTIDGSSSNDFKYMILNNTAGLTLSAKVNIFKVLTVTAGELKAGGNLTIKSKDVTTSTGTAQVTQLPASGASITGNVTVERFIPAGLRSYRHLSCPVNSVSIFNSWQDSGANNAGFGVQITGTTANRANIGAGNAANGLDYTLSSGYSMYTMTTSNVMSPVTNTKTTNFTPGLGYNIFIRGDRATNLYNTSVTTNTQTTLRATGLLNQGNVTVSLCNGWNIIGNPYASTIAWNASGWSTARGANTGATVYILNPAVVSGTSNRFACHNGVVGTNGWPATGPYIESGQGFYVYTTAATSITFKEEYKTSNEAAIYFKNNSIADLLRIEYLSNGVHQDDIAINFRDGGKTILDLAVDAETMASATNGIASLKNASRLAINTRPVFETIDTVALSVMSTTTGKFSMKFTELASFSGMTQIILVDKFLNKMINVDQNVTYNFDITANPNSKGNNRFVMLFSKVGTAAFTTGLANATEEVSTVSLYPNPATSTINLACSNANVKDFSYEIYNQMGQSVSTGAGNFANGNVEAVNIENLDKGIYFVKMFYNNNAEIIRFIK